MADINSCEFNKTDESVIQVLRNILSKDPSMKEELEKRIKDKCGLKELVKFARIASGLTENQFEKIMITYPETLEQMLTEK